MQPAPCLQRTQLLARAELPGPVRLPGPRAHGPSCRCTVSPQVISGQQLPKVASSKASAIVDPLVRVEIHGVPADQARRETQYVDNNGESGPGQVSLAPARGSPASSLQLQACLGG